MFLSSYLFHSTKVRNRDACAECMNTIMSFSQQDNFGINAKSNSGEPLERIMVGEGALCGGVCGGYWCCVRRREKVSPEVLGAVLLNKRSNLKTITQCLGRR